MANSLGFRRSNKGNLRGNQRNFKSLYITVLQDLEFKNKINFNKGNVRNSL